MAEHRRFCWSAWTVILETSVFWDKGERATKDQANSIQRLVNTCIQLTMLIDGLGNSMILWIFKTIVLRIFSDSWNWSLDLCCSSSGHVYSSDILDIDIRVYIYPCKYLCMVTQFTCLWPLKKIAKRYHTFCILQRPLWLGYVLLSQWRSQGNLLVCPFINYVYILCTRIRQNVKQFSRIYHMNYIGLIKHIS